MFLYTFSVADPSLTALASEVEALRAALLQKEQQVASVTSPFHTPAHLVPGLATTHGMMPAQPPVYHMTTTGLATMPPGVVPSQSYLPQFANSGLVTTPVLVPSETYVPHVATSSSPSMPAAAFTQTYVPAVVQAPSQDVVSGSSPTRTVPAVPTVVTSPSQRSPQQVHHYHYFSGKNRQGTTENNCINFLITISSSSATCFRPFVSVARCASSRIFRVQWG